MAPISVANVLMYGMYVRYMHTVYVLMFKYNHLLMQRVQLCTSYGWHSTSWTQLQFINVAAGAAICITHLYVCSSTSCVAQLNNQQEQLRMTCASRQFAITGSFNQHCVNIMMVVHVTKVLPITVWPGQVCMRAASLVWYRC